MNYEKLWKEHQQWLSRGIEYYTAVLRNFENTSGLEYDKVSNQLANFEFQLDSLERREKLEAKEYNKV